MNINLTLIVQMLVFVVLIGFVMKFVWPMILGAMDERSKKIALGLAAAEKGQQQLQQAHQKTRGHHPRGARAGPADHRSGAASRQRGHRAGQGHRRRPRAAARCRRAAADRARVDCARASVCASEVGQARRAGGIEAPRARDRCAGARGSHRQARGADLDDR